MKSQRRKELNEIRKQLVSLNAIVQEKLQSIEENLQTLYDNLEEQFDNLSERSQEGTAGERVQDDMDDVDYILDSVREIAEADEVDTEYSVFSEIFEQIDTLLDKEY